MSNTDQSIVNISELTGEERQGLVCMYFARLSSDDMRYKGICYKVLAKLSEHYNIKFKTLTNHKDAFDACFENGRKGWRKEPLQKQNRLLYDMYIKHKDLPIDEHALIVDKIIEEISKDKYKFFGIKTKNPEQVQSILNKESNIEIDGLNILKDELKLNQIIFIVLGGDKGRAEVTWETGLIGMGIVSQAPYDEGYEGRNYKIKIDVKVLLDNPIKREDLVSYRDTYDIIGIGPITKWEPNQAISSINEKKAVALMRAMLELCPGIDSDLSNVIDNQLMTRVKGATIKLVPQEVDYGEKVKSEIGLETDEENEGFDSFVSTYNPDIIKILEGFSMSDKPIISLKNFINSGKHIIMTGPPGTGKTTLAENACIEAVSCNYITGYMMTTAVSDWSTFDTIGGYMPDKNNNLIFQEGIFLKSIRENKWLIVDEINRAEVDKAFGHFFTILAGKDVELQFKTDTDDGNEQNISIKHSNTLGSYYDNKTATYYIGKNWRIIATMNTYDKNSLFMLSYAFMRRFAFVYIPSPNENDFTELINSRLEDKYEIKEILLHLTKISPKKLGAAIIIDLIAYLESSNYDGIIDGICSLIIPQYEGISMPQIKQLYKDLGSLFNGDDRDILRNYLCEFFDISSTELIKVKFIDEADDEEIEEDIE